LRQLNIEMSASERDILLLQVAYVLFLVGWKIRAGEFPGILFLFAVVLVGFIWAARTRSFLFALTPFVILLWGYESLRAIANDITPAQVNVTNLIAWERALFGGAIPAYQVQQALAPYSGFFDLFCSAFYATHFVAPLVLGLLLWHLRRAHYWGFMAGLLAMSYAGFVTYVLFPAAPPWWASYFGYLEESIAGHAGMIAPEYLLQTPNPVAAMPSLHAAYPLYIALVAVHVWGRKAAAVFVLPAGVSFATLYLGHHYVVDLLAGYAYAGAAFAFTVWLARSRQRALQAQPKATAVASE
jgi:membrane-associated phospholipid phosphatase